MKFNESDAVEILNVGGQGAVVILCEHASNFIPSELNGLGLNEDERISHIAWDPGARAVSLNLAKALDAPFVAGRTSRLVFDCNRPPEDASAIPARSEVTDVPGNQVLSQEDRAARTKGVYAPFCSAVTNLLRSRDANGLSTIIVTMHSFTPIYFGASREVEIGILTDTDTRLADAMLAEAGALPHRIVQRNAPYGPEDGVTHSLKLHGIANGLPNVMIEIRNDLISNTDGQKQLTDEVLTLLRPALATLDAGACNHA